MIHQSFSIRHAFIQSFQKIYMHLGFLFGLLCIQMGIIIGTMLLYSFSAAMIASFFDVSSIAPETLPLGGFITLIILRSFTILMEILLFVVTIRIFLDIYDQGKSSYNDFFQIKKFLIPYIFASILFALASALGFVLLIIPGLIVITMLNFYDIIVIDQNCGAIESLKISKKITEGTRVKLFLFIVVCTLLSSITFGLLYPVILMARIDVYKKLKAAQSWF